jgi:hypothetical protein
LHQTDTTHDHQHDDHALGPHSHEH